LKPLLEARGASAFAAVQEWRRMRGLPRYVALADFDNELVINLDNVLSVEAFLHLVKGRSTARLGGPFPPPAELCAGVAEGRFVHELVVPFVKAEGSGQRTDKIYPSASLLPPAERTFPPGSEWLYAKLYTGTASADRLLVEAIRP